MEKTWLFLLAALAIIAIAWYAARKSRMRGEKRVLKDQVQTWEDEGGHVPEVPTVGPAPPRPDEAPDQARGVREAVWRPEHESNVRPTP